MMKPLGSRVLVKVLEVADTTVSGLFIPDSAKERPCEGEVVAVGEGRVTESGIRIPLDVKVGDLVIYAKYAGTEVKVGAVDCLLLNGETDILAIYE